MSALIRNFMKTGIRAPSTLLAPYFKSFKTRLQYSSASGQQQQEQRGKAGGGGGGGGGRQLVVKPATSAGGQQRMNLQNKKNASLGPTLSQPSFTKDVKTRESLSLFQSTYRINEYASRNLLELNWINPATLSIATISLFHTNPPKCPSYRHSFQW